MDFEAKLTGALEKRQRLFDLEIADGATGPKYWNALKPLVRIRRANFLVSLGLECLFGPRQNDVTEALRSVSSILPGFWATAEALPSQRPDIEASWEDARVWHDVSCFAGTLGACALFNGSHPPGRVYSLAVSLAEELLHRSEDLDGVREGLRKCNRDLKVWACEYFVLALHVPDYKRIGAFYDAHFAWPLDRPETTVENAILKLAYCLAMKGKGSQDPSLAGCTERMKRVTTSMFVKSQATEITCELPVQQMYLLIHRYLVDSGLPSSAPIIAALLRQSFGSGRNQRAIK